ncbi:invasion associated locus B family protein [Taklimakanibacter lacteus]|uniref:invasion associated locus B family protein n=1 Tax=Taklimakanibacter lacteus TaxID=2268456 RepID=UPI000E66ABBD
MICKPAAWSVVLAPLAVLAGLVPALAQAPQPTDLGKFGDWAAYTYKAQGGKVCYISSQPKVQSPKNAKRDPAFLLVTHRPSQSVRNEVSTIIGYPFKKDTPVQLTIDATDFELFANGDGAWADTAAKDKEIVGAMKKGQKLTIKGASWRGTETLDSYSLKGLAQALAKIDAACK